MKTNEEIIKEKRKCATKGCYEIAEYEFAGVYICKKCYYYVQR